MVTPQSRETINTGQQQGKTSRDNTQLLTPATVLACETPGNSLIPQHCSRSRSSTLQSRPEPKNERQFSPDIIHQLSWTVGPLCKILNAPQTVLRMSTNNTCIVYGTGCTSPTNLPSYIDNQACLCGLLESRSSLPNNGEHIELWRCIGNASDNVEDGGNGKWYNTSLPSQELSGINQPQNW